MYKNGWLQLKCIYITRKRGHQTGQLLHPTILLAAGPLLDTVSPRSYIRWISSLYSVKDLSGMAGVNSNTSPIFNLHMGSFTGWWFSLGLNSSFKGKPYGVHLELPRPDLSNKSIIVELAGNSCTDICNFPTRSMSRSLHWINSKPHPWQKPLLNGS